MQQMNEPATRIFGGLLEKLGSHQSLQIHSGSFMPLTMENLLEPITTAAGNGALYSLCHYHEQNGDLMRDPEMCFIVVDNRTHPKDYDQLLIFPQRFRQDSEGLDEESICIQQGKISSYIEVWQKDHCRFANMWLKNLRQQGFLK